MEPSFYLSEFLKLIPLTISIRNITEKKRDKIINALTSTQHAINLTQSFLVRNEGKYEIREDLAEAWVQAAKSFYFVDYNLARMLMNKSSFWSDPELWISVGQDRQIPKLNELRDEIEILERRLH